jgi:hypothetical protein
MNFGYSASKKMQDSRFFGRTTELMMSKSHNTHGFLARQRKFQRLSTAIGHWRKNEGRA